MELCQSPEQARTHTHMLGPTGTGKSSLLVGMALDDLQQGVGIVPWMDPKDGLAADALLARIPEKHADRVVLVDPNRLDYSVGLNVLEHQDPDQRDIVVDQILAVFAQLFRSVWGPRQAEIMQLGLMTLTLDPRATLCDLAPLLTDKATRQRRKGRLGGRHADLLSSWERYEKMPAADVAPLLGRLQDLLMRPRVRQVLGQRKSTVDLADILDHGGIVIARLPLQLERTSQLLGSFLLLRTWQIAQGRQSRAEHTLKDAAAYLDEGHLFLHIRGSVAGLFDLARSVRWGIIFAHQRLGQIEGTELAEALRENALSKIVFRPTSVENAKAAANLVPPLLHSDLLQLESRQAVYRLPDLRPFVGRTPELPPPLRDPRELADHALKRWGTPREKIEAELGISEAGPGLLGYD